MRLSVSISHVYKHFIFLYTTTRNRSGQHFPIHFLTNERTSSTLKILYASSSSFLILYSSLTFFCSAFVFTLHTFLIYKPIKNPYTQNLKWVSKTDTFIDLLARANWRNRNNKKKPMCFSSIVGLKTMTFKTILWAVQFIN